MTLLLFVQQASCQRNLNHQVQLDPGPFFRGTQFVKPHWHESEKAYKADLAWVTTPVLPWFLHLRQCRNFVCAANADINTHKIRRIPARCQACKNAIRRELPTLKKNSEGSMHYLLRNPSYICTVCISISLNYY